MMHRPLNIKNKLTVSITRRHIDGVEAWLHSFLILALYKGSGQIHTSTILLQERNPLPTEQELVWTFW